MQENISKISLCRKVRSGKLWEIATVDKNEIWQQQYNNEDDEINQIKRQRYVTTYKTDDISVKCENQHHRYH